MLKRIFSNTAKQISRSGWSSWASISVMTLAFLVAIIFGGLAYISNLYIHFIESKSNVLVFFNEGMDPEIIANLKAQWTANPKIKDIGFTSEDDAYRLYSDYTAVVQQEIFAVLKTKENKTLPSSLDIQIYSLEDLQSVRADLEKDIEAENQKLLVIDTSSETKNPASFPVSTSTLPLYKFGEAEGDKPVKLRIDDESLEQLRQVLYFIRIVGLIVLVILFVGIFFFTFMAVEFRLQSQMEEIGVMQLVGGSLFFIRSPYILEGGFYGLIGAVVSSLVIGSFLFVVFVLNKGSTVAVFLFKTVDKLPWPYVTIPGWVAIVSGIAFVGFMIGAMSSYLSIKRYIR